MDLRYMRGQSERDGQINLDWLIFAYENFPEREAFFTAYFNTLAGTAELQQQIVDGIPAREIRSGWSRGIAAFKEIRKKYLLYPDFE
jgi:uncharacterized protein YbbC (DUF1343 family)